MIPDGIAPKSAWRAWHLRGNRITSSNQNVVWEPGVPIKAFCPSLGQGENLMVNVLEQGRADVIRNHMAQNYSPPIYEVDEGENRVYFTKKSYLLIPRAIPVMLRVPSMNCQCGIYAANSLEEAMQYGEIVGRVAMWGYVITHSGGYRAQYAYPQSFYGADGLVETIKKTLADYQVPVFGISEVWPRRSKSQEEAAAEAEKSDPGTISEYDTQDEDDEDDPTPGDGVRRITLRDIKRAIDKIRLM